MSGPGLVPVLDAIFDWFNGQIPGIGTWYPSQSRLSDEEMFTASLATGTPTGAIAFPYFGTISEQRIAFGGPTGGLKQVTIPVTFVLWSWSQQEEAEAADRDLKRITDALKLRIRQDRTWGTGGDPIFQAGEGTGRGSPSDVRDDTREPVIDEEKGGAIFRIVQLRTTVVSMIFA